MLQRVVEVSISDCCRLVLRVRQIKKVVHLQLINAWNSVVSAVDVAWK